MYAPGASSDGLIDLWFDDGTHASVYGSYLSALTLFGQHHRRRSLVARRRRNWRRASSASAAPMRCASNGSRASSSGSPPRVPEPATFALTGLGLGWLAWRRRPASRGG
jgi:hypothetical protein